MPAFATIAQFATIPHPKTFRFLYWADDLCAYNLAYCSAARTTAKYISVAGSGDGTGSSAANTKACATPAALATFIAANIGSGDIEFLLRMGERFRATDAAKTCNIQLNQASAKLGYFAVDATDLYKDPPEITGFKAAYGAYTDGTTGWLDATTRGDVNTSVYSRADTTTVNWVRGSATARYEDMVRTPYRRWVSGANLAARIASLNARTDRCFFWESNVLYVNTGSAANTAELATIEACVGTGVGVVGTNVDKVLVDAVRITAWGMDSDNAQTPCLQTTCKGTNTFAARRVECLWGNWHVASHYLGSAANSGGTALWFGCRYGLSLWTASGGAALVDYNYDGGHEALRYGCSYVGALLTQAYVAERGYGQPSYAHTNGGSAKAALVLEVNPTYEDHPTNLLGDICWAADLPAMSTKRDYATCRGYFIGDRGKAMMIDGCAAVNYLRINNRLTLLAYSVEAGAPNDASSWMGAWFNCDMSMDWTVRTDTAGYNLFNAPGTQNYADLVHSCLRLKLPGGATFYADCDLTLTTNVQAWNTIWANVGPGDAYPGIPNLDARSNVGGHAGCAFYRMKRADLGGPIYGWSAAGAAVDLHCQNLDNLPTPELIGTAVGTPSLPSDLDLEYDIDRRVRAPYTKVIGPVADNDRRYMVQPFRTSRCRR